MTHVTLSNCGIRLAASVHGPMDAAPLLLLHGLTLSRDTWDEIAERLRGRYCVWTLDFRGHGHSDRAPTYDLAGYVSDAATALAAIGRPTIVVGHSLGACVAGTLCQGNPGVRAVFLEDPPWFLGSPEEWQRSTYPKLFYVLWSRLTKWQQEAAPLATYLGFLSNGPDSLGGVVKDHISGRHLLGHASAIQRLDPSCIGAEALQAALSPIRTERPFPCPAKLVRGEERFGAAFWDRHVDLLMATNPHMDIVEYTPCGHHPHRMVALEERFFRDLENFLAEV